MKIPLHKVGNTHAVFIPKTLLDYFQFSNEVELALSADGITIRKPRRSLRHGWLAAAHKVWCAEERLDW